MNGERDGTPFHPPFTSPYSPGFGVAEAGAGVAGAGVVEGAGVLEGAGVAPGAGVALGTGAGDAEGAGLLLTFTGCETADGPCGADAGLFSTSTGAGDAAGAGAGVAAGSGAVALSCRWASLFIDVAFTWSHESRAVRIKNATPSARVIFCSTLVVCAPNMFSVIPPPKAAPSPSLFGRCMSTTRMSSRLTMMRRTRRMLMRICMAGWLGEKGAQASGHPAPCKEEV